MDRFVYLLPVGLTFSVAGCDAEHPPRTLTENKAMQTCSYRVLDTATRTRLDQALAKSSVTYDTVEPNHGGGGLVYRARDSACEALRDVTTSVVGPSLPTGRHMHLDSAHQSRFKQWLIAERIPFETRVRDGVEYVVWEAKDSPRVREWKFFPGENPAFFPPEASSTERR